jgi:hypothetical protein
MNWARVALGIWCWLVPTWVQAEHPGAAANAFSDLAPRPGEARKEHQQALERSLEHLLSGLNTVTDARVHLALPDPAMVALDQPLPRPQCTVLLQVAGKGPTDPELQALLAPSLKAYGNAELHLVKNVAIAREVPLKPVPNAENPLFRHALVGSLIANVLLATLLLARARARSL